MEVIPILFSGAVGNCYLLHKNREYVLADTARISGRKRIERVLANTGCMPEHLALIVRDSR